MRAATEYCPTCWCTNGVQNLLKRISINFDDAIIVCTNSECDYMRIPSGDEFAPEQISSSDAGSSVVSMGDDLVQLLDQLFASSPIPSPSTAVAAAALPCTDSGIEMELLSVSSAASLETCRSVQGALSSPPVQQMLSPPAGQMSLSREAVRSGIVASESRTSRRTRRRPDFYDETTTPSVRRRRSDIYSQRGSTVVTPLPDDQQDGMSGLRLASLGNCQQAPLSLPRKLPPRKRLHKGGPPQSSKLCSVRVDGYGSSVGVDSEGNALQRILAGSQLLAFTTACSSVSTASASTYSQVPSASSHSSAISYVYNGPVSAAIQLPGSSSAAGAEICPSRPLNVTSDGSFTGASSSSTGMMVSCSASCLAAAGVSTSCSFMYSDSGQIRRPASTPLVCATPESWRRARSTTPSIVSASSGALSTATTLRLSSPTELAEEAPTSLTKIDKSTHSNVGSRLSRGFKRKTVAGQLCQPLSETAVESTPRLSEAPLASIRLQSEAPVASMPLLSETAVASMPPLSETAVASTPPLSEAPVASMPPLSETAVASTPPLSEAPAASMPPLSETAVASTPPITDILRLDSVFIRSRQVERVKAWARCRAARSRSSLFPVERPRP